jgi:uncharacterized membrane protein
MEQYKEKLKITNFFLMIGCVILAVFAVLAIGSELGWFHILRPVAGDSHWHSRWFGFVTGASCGIFAFMFAGLIRNCRALKDDKKLKKLYVKEHDERTIQIQTLARNTAMQILLLGGLVAVVIAGYFSITVSLTILACIFAASVTSLLLVGYYSKKL